MPRITRRTATAGLMSATLLSALPAHADAPPLRIGLGIAQSGGLAAFGKSALLAMQLWTEAINAQGGLLGRKVELVAYDDQSNPTTVPGIYAKLIDVDKVDLVVSGYATNQIAAAMPTIMQKKRLFLTLFGLGLNDRFKYDRYFQMQPNGPDARIEFSRGYMETAMKMDPKPVTIALAGADAEFSNIALDGARANAKAAGLKVVYDRLYPPNTIEFSSIIRAIKATNADLVYVASYPPDSAGLVKAVREVGLNAKMFGGGMIGLQSAALKTQLGPMLNGVVAYDMYVPEPTMKFPGIEQFLVKYREEAAKSGIDPLGFYIAPFAYAEMQILGDAVKAVGSLDEGKLAEYIHAQRFDTIVGDVKFQERGEWAEPRVLMVQYQGIVGNDLAQFKEAGRQVIITPEKYKSGEFKYPFNTISN